MRKKLKTSGHCLELFVFLSFLRFATRSFPSVQMNPSTVAAPGFSAYYAHKRACRTAQRLATSTQPKPCGACKGTKSMSIIMEVIDAGTITKSNHTIPCVHCKDGIVNPLKEMYSSLIWCKCKHSATSQHILAHDGVRVFGKTTYLCGACGFVKQFG